MCGIALILGPRPDRATFRRMITSLAPRGEVEEVLLTDRLLAGTQRLRIVDAEHAIQPWRSADGRWVLCYNGEVFNYRALQAELASRGHRLRSDSDTEVVLEAFLEWGAAAVRRLRGEFAFALADTVADRVYLARDPLGVKPLYWSRRDGCLYVASEVKALTGVGAPVSEVPPGHHGWAAAADVRAAERGGRRSGWRGGPGPGALRRPAPAGRGPAGDRGPGRGGQADPGRAGGQHPGPGGHRADRRGHPVRRPGQHADPAARAGDAPGLCRVHHRRAGQPGPGLRAPADRRPRRAA